MERVERIAINIGGAIDEQENISVESDSISTDKQETIPLCNAIFQKYSII